MAPSAFGDSDPDLTSVARHHHRQQRRIQAEVERELADLEANTQRWHEVLMGLDAARTATFDVLGGHRVEGRIGHVGVEVIGIRSVGDLFPRPVRTGRTGTPEPMIFVAADSLVGVGVSQARTALDDHVRPVRTTGHPGTLLALLRHLALDHSTATIGRKWSEVVSGTILSVSEEVIAGRGESEDWFVPVAAVSWVRPTEGLKSML